MRRMFESLIIKARDLVQTYRSTSYAVAVRLPLSGTFSLDTQLTVSQSVSSNYRRLRSFTISLPRGVGKAETKSGPRAVNLLNPN
jgi:hypothetical protein